METINQFPGKFKKVKLHQETANSSIFFAFDMTSKQEVAIKFIPQSSSFYQGVFDEFKILFQFKHPNLVEVIDFGKIEKKGIYYTMPKYHKIDPVEYCKKNKIKGFLNIFFQLLCGLHFLHQRGKHHGDLTLNNIFVTEEEGQLSVKITDFGLSSLIAADKISDISGTAKYLAPELLIGKATSSINRQSDLYSLGIVLYEIISGKPPFSDKDVIKLMEDQICRNIPQLKSLFSIEAGITDMIYKLLEKEPAKRFRDCHQVLEKLLPFINKYEMKKEEDSFFWKNVLLEMRKNKKIDFIFYRRKVINSLHKKINSVFRNESKSIFLLLGDESNCLQDTILYLTFEMKKEGKKVIFLKKNTFDLMKTEEIKSNILTEIELEQKNVKEDIEKAKAGFPRSQIILVIPELSVFQENFRSILKFIEDNPKLKLLTAVNSNDPAFDFSNHKKIQINQLKPMSNEEMEEYLELSFGVKILPEKLQEIILKNSARNITILDQFIDLYIEQDVISYRNLKWFFDLSKLNPELIPEGIENRFKLDFSKLQTKQKDFLSLLSLWKENFELKEISEIEQISLIKTTDQINNLKEKKILIQPSKKISFRYPFLPRLIQQTSDPSVLKKQSEKIRSYLTRKSKISDEEEMLLFEINADLKNCGEMLLLASQISKKDNKNMDKLLRIGNKIYENKTKLNKSNADEFLLILNYFVWALEKNSEYEKAIEVFNFQNKNSELCSDQNLKNEIFVRNLYFLNRKDSFQEVVDIFLKNKMMISKFPNPQRVRALQHISFAYKMIDKIDDQKKLLTEILQICKKTKDDSLLNQEFTALEDYGFAEYLSGNIKKALSLFKQGAQIAEKLKNRAGSAYIHCRMASMYIDLFKLEETLKQLKVATKIMKKCKVKYPLLVLNNTYGNYYLAKEHYWQALKKYHEAYLLFKEQNEDWSVPLVNKCLPLNKLGYYRQAIDCSEKALDYKIKNNQIGLFGLWKSYQMISFYYLGNKKKAEEIFSEIKKMEKERKISLTFNAHLYQAYFSLLEKNYPAAEKQIKFLQKNFAENDDDTVENSNNFLLAKLYFEKSELRKANKHISLVIKKFEKIKTSEFENQELYLLAYQIKKAAFKKNLITENYKKFLQTAKEILTDKIENLPTNKMKEHYLKKYLNKEIINFYADEFEGKEKIFKKSGFDMLEIIEEMTEIISKVTDKKKLFTKILELAVKVTKAERGLILTRNSETGNAEVEFSYQIKDDSLSDITSVSQQIIKQVLEKKKAVYHTDVKKNKSFDQYQSFVNLKIESVVCLPLLIHNQVLGTVYLDSRSLLAFTPEEIQFLHIFAQIAASAIETSDNYCQLKLEKEKLSGYMESSANRKHPSIIGNSTKMEELFKKIEQISRTDVNVLIEGESGTGKELVAREIHRLSKRNNKPFIPIDCGSLSEDIIESELFGHLKGAFTGALIDKKGLFEETNEGTLFLDEISNISLGTQAKLLRVIQEGEVKRLGENFVRKVNVRVLVASNIPLQKLVAEGKFRQDLFYRLSIFPITVPKLNERENDVIILAQHFLKYFTALHNRNIPALTDDALQKIANYDFPGNVRQLQNEIERAVIMFNEYGKALPGSFFDHLSTDEKYLELASNISEITNFAETVDKFKLKLIEDALKKADKNWTKAAKLLGLSRQNLSQIYKRLK